MPAFRIISLALAAALTGCAADVQTTDDSTKLELEVPKVEIKGTPDLDPSTDHDVEIKAPGKNGGWVIDVPRPANEVVLQRSPVRFRCFQRQ